MIVSQNEIETTALKAARGAGFAWGEAEEIGWAARWLAGRGLDVAAPLAGLLGDAAGHDDPDCCPIRIGLDLADRDALPIAGSPLLLSRVRWPVWLLPFACRLLAATQRPLQLCWDGAEAWLLPDSGGVRLAVAGELTGPSATPVVVRMHDAPPTRLEPRSACPGECRVDAVAWQCLARLEAATYVPASRHSRESGAGAGLSDDD